MLIVKFKGSVGSFKLDVDIEAGHGITALYGVSGAGKSSILRAVAGLWEPEQGLIKVGERVLFDSANGINVAPSKRRLGVVFQEPLLFPHMNVEKNLAFGQRSNEDEWNNVIELLELKDLLQRMPRNLSGGEAQRVAIGRALLSDPQVILFDEPMSGLDEARRRQLLPYLEKVRDEAQVPIVYVSHHREELINLADSIFWVENGVAKKQLTSTEFHAATELPPIVRRDKV